MNRPILVLLLMTSSLASVAAARAPLDEIPAATDATNTADAAALAPHP